MNFKFNINFSPFNKKEKSLGIHFGKGFLKIAMLDKNKQGLNLPIIPFKIEVSGDPEEIGKILHEEIERRNINPDIVVAGLNYESVLFRNLKLPKVKKEELEDAIQYNIREDLKSIKGETFYDYSILGEDENDLQNILIAIAHKKDIDIVNTVLKVAGLNMDIVDTEPTALINLAFLHQHVSEEKEENICVVHLEDNYSFIVFYNKGIITQTLNFNSREYEKLNEDEKEKAVEGLINEINYFFLTVNEPKIIYLSGNSFKFPEIKAYSQLKFATRFKIEELNPVDLLNINYKGNIPLGIFNVSLSLANRGFLK